MIESKDKLPPAPPGQRWKMVASGTFDRMQERADRIEDADYSAVCEVVYDPEKGGAATVYRLAKQRGEGGGER